MSNFDACVKLVLDHEGGNDDDPRDPGGRTSRGIIQSEWTEWRKAHPGLPSDVWQAPQDQVIAIYEAKYWDAMNCGALANGVDYCVFDYGVNSGVGRARKVLAGVLTANSRAEDLINDICDERLAFLKSLSTWGTYGRGWATRVSDVRRDALVMSKGAAVEPPKPVPPAEHPKVVDFGQRIKNTMQALNYPWFSEPGDQNVVSVEGMNPDGTYNKNRNNAFDDCKMVLDPTGKIIGGPWEATTAPGVYWTTHPMASGGAFIIAKGPQACWTPGDYHGNEVWRQAGDSTIMGHRDPNATYKRQGPPVKHGDIGVHHHGGYNLPRDDIANAAAGCQVIRLTGIPGQKEFMQLTKKNPLYLRDPKNFRLTATVLTADEVREHGDLPVTPVPVTPKVTPPAPPPPPPAPAAPPPAPAAPPKPDMPAASAGAATAVATGIVANLFGLNLTATAVVMVVVAAAVGATLYWLHKKGKI